MAREIGTRQAPTAFSAAGASARQGVTMPRNGNTTARGYGRRHQQDRARWAPLVDQGAVTCRRCGWPIEPGQAWDLGHDDHDRALPTAPEHRHRTTHCIGNRAAGTRKTNASRRLKTGQARITTIDPAPRPMTQW